MPLKPLPLTVQTLYADLVQQVSASGVRPGSVYRRTINGAAYFYAKVPVGQGRHDRFLGRCDDPEAQALVRSIEEETRRAAPRPDALAERSR